MDRDIRYAVVAAIAVTVGFAVAGAITDRGMGAFELGALIALYSVLAFGVRVRAARRL